MIFKYGFLYRNVRYGWYKKELYRLPFSNNKKSYGLKKINPIRNGKVYNLQRVQKTIANIQLMTIEVNYEVNVTVAKECPF